MREVEGFQSGQVQVQQPDSVQGASLPSTSLPPAGFALHVFARDLNSSTVFLIELFFAFEFAFLVFVNSVRSSLRRVCVTKDPFV